jgi:hypothetical protein
LKLFVLFARQPDEVGVISHNLLRNMPSSTDLNNKIAQEMFDGVIREIVEETGVPANTLVWHQPPSVIL